jgi:hypothetical protein
MTTTVKAVLFGDADPGPAVGRLQAWPAVVGKLGGLLGHVSPGGRVSIERELAGALAGLLDLDVGDMLVAGWRHHRALVAAAHATAADPNAVEVVQLATHRITAQHHPYVDIVVNGAKVVTVHFDLGLTFDVDSFLGTVRYGRLASIQSGRCTTTVGLGCEGHDLVTRQFVFDAPVTVRLGEGVPLVQDQRRPAPA